jgi:hypothetical protein
MANTIQVVDTPSDQFFRVLLTRLVCPNASELALIRQDIRTHLRTREVLTDPSEGGK